MKTVDAENVLVFLDVTKTERKRLLAAAENEPVKKKQKLLSRGEMASMLGVRRESVKRYDRTGLLHPIRITSRMVRYEEDDVMELLNGRE